MRYSWIATLRDEIYSWLLIPIPQRRFREGMFSHTGFLAMHEGMMDAIRTGYRQRG